MGKTRRPRRTRPRLLALPKSAWVILWCTLFFQAIVLFMFLVENSKPWTSAGIMADYYAHTHRSLVALFAAGCVVCIPAIVFFAMRVSDRRVRIGFTGLWIVYFLLLFILTPRITAVIARATWRHIVEPHVLDNMPDPQTPN